MKLTTYYITKISGKTGRPSKESVSGYLIPGTPFATRKFQGWWIVDHVPSGYAAAPLTRRTRAAAIADTIRFAKYARLIGCNFGRAKRYMTKAQAKKCRAWFKRQKIP